MTALDSMKRCLDISQSKNTLKIKGIGQKLNENFKIESLEYDFRTSDKFCRGEIHKFFFTLKRQTKVFSHFLSFEK